MGAAVAKEIRPEKVAIYIRWSTEEQTDGTTLAEQREGCEFYVKSQGWFVNPSLIFIDDGFSGASLDRPGMRQIRHLVQKGQVDCVVVLKIDRLSRNIVDATQLVLDEWKDRCHLRCVRQPIDTTSETGRMFFSILATFADFERAQITERTYQGRVRRIKEGKAAFSIPFGLAAGDEPGVRIPDPVAAPVVAEMFRKVREESAGPSALVEWLKGQGVSPPRGEAWNAVTVRRMLKNPIYCGRIVYGTATTVKKAGNRYPSRQKRDEPMISLDESSVPALVPPDLFEEVQAIMEKRTAFHSKHRAAEASTHLLTGTAVCRCGAPINAHWSRGVRYYWCSRRITYGPSGCPAEGGCMLADVLDQRVVQDLLETFSSLQQRDAAFRTEEGSSSEELLAAQRELDSLASEMARLDKRVDELRLAAGVGDISLDEWRDLRDSIEAKRKVLAAKQTACNQAIARVNAGLTEVRMLQTQVAHLERWSEMDAVMQKSLVRELAEKIELYKPKGKNQKYQMRVTWRFKP